MNIANIIVITLLVLLILFLINRVFFKTNIIYDIMCEAHDVVEDPTYNSPSLFKSNKNIIYNKDFPENNSTNFMLSVWFYIDAWKEKLNQEKNILFIANDGGASIPPALTNQSIHISKSVCGESTLFKNLGLTLDKYENNLFIDIETLLSSSDDCSGSKFTRYKLKNIPVQKWNNLTISVDTKLMDVYLDGKLRNSFILHNVYKNDYNPNSAKNIYLGTITQGSTMKNQGFKGFITRIRYESNSINPQEAYNIYREGINSSLARSIYSKYKLS